MFDVYLKNGTHLSIFADGFTLNRDNKKILHIIFIKNDNTVITCINIKEINTIKHFYTYKDIVKEVENGKTT